MEEEVDGGAVAVERKPAAVEGKAAAEEEVMEDEEDHDDDKAVVAAAAKTTIVKMLTSESVAVEPSSGGGSTVNGDVRAEDSEHDDDDDTSDKPNKDATVVETKEVDAEENHTDDKDSSEEHEKMDVETENKVDKQVDGKVDEVEVVEESVNNNDAKMDVDEDELEVRKRAEENERKEAEILEQLGKVDDVIVGEKKACGSKEQTIIITETKSLAKAINEAVKKPDGKPTLVIIESKSSSSNNSSSPGAKTSGGKMSVPTSPSTGMTLRSRSRMEAQGNGTPHSGGGAGAATASKTSGRSSRTENSNVALKDDADINIYTPSLMVPYIYECPPKEKLADFLNKIGATASKKVALEEKKKVEDEAVIQNGEQPKKEKTFFDSALGLFFTDIGLLQAQRWVQCEVLRVEKRKLDKGWSSKERKSLVFNLKRTLEDIEKQVKPFQFQLKSCTRCEFKTESQTVLDRHLETIHVTGNRMTCSYCDFSTVEPSQIFQHLYASHKAFGRLERPPALHQCPMCPVEDSAKARVTRHMFKCLKTFVADKNQSPSNDFEPPAKRIRHVATVATLKAMRAGASVDKMSSAAALTTSQIYQMQQNRNSALTGQQHPAAQRPQPPPIRPKPGDIRLSPAYVQSVLRGQYMSSANVRGLTPGLASQLFQVINPSTAGGLVPLVRGGTIGGLNTQRFTILPTPPVTINNRGPTPVALIPNLVTTSKTTTTSLTTSLTAASVQQQLRSSQNHSGAAGKVGSQKPNISITPVNKPMNKFNVSTLSNKASVVGGSSSAGSTTTAGTRLSQQQNQAQQQQGGGSSLYVVCEICDGYIKDLDQLRNHMQWIHKVKIHPKMIHNRPPLNCQKCHFRFFTDQGLERHLLGSHGLVTSSMQENANKGKDGGRCIICGKVFLWKLVVHMAKDHKMTLKPAHLSYKCTVCSATFNMYRLFETHVYDEHSTVAKRVLDGQKNVSGAAAAAYQAASQANKPKVNNPSNNNQSQVNKTTTTVSSSTTSTTATAANASSTAAIKPATSRITLHPEPRVCDDCGVTFKRGGNCDRHWEPTKLKPCNANLCRVDKCDACLDKNNAAKANNNSTTTAVVVVSTAAAATTTSAAAVVSTPKVVTASKMPQPKLAANGKSSSTVSNQAEKVSNKAEKVEKTTAETMTTTTTAVVADAAVDEPTKAAAQPQSDGEDVFDMEVETVDENGSSPGYDARSDVESD